LAVHVDNGWNSELAVSNIEKMVRKLNIDTGLWRKWGWNWLNLWKDTC